MTFKRYLKMVYMPNKIEQEFDDLDIELANKALEINKLNNKIRKMKKEFNDIEDMYKRNEEILKDKIEQQKKLIEELYKDRRS